LINLHRNELRRADEAAALAKHHLERRRGSPYRGAWAVWAQALVLEAHHGRPAALSILAECWDDCLAGGLLVDLPIVGPDLVRLAVAGGEVARARQVCRVVAEVAAMNGVPSISGAALRCRGLADDDPELLLAAADAYARGPRVLDTALVREETGHALLRHGEVDSGRSQLVQALELYDGLNAARGLLRSEAALRGTGVRLGRRGSRKRPQRGWLSLTPTECTIAGLVAEGRSNPQIADQLYVSHRTVQTHVSHIFVKLDISSRAQLAAEVTRQRG
jgi:DNA-binding CsgD family transcriptional regulator